MIAYPRRLGGWRGSVLLLLLYVIVETASVLLGGDWGVFLWVTFHFIVTPILSLGLMLLTVPLLFGQRATAWERIATASSLIVPTGIIALAVFGEPGLLRLLPAY